MNRESVPTINKNRVWHIKKKINLENIKKGAKFLIGKRDFSTFRASACSAKSPIRTLEKVNILKKKIKYLLNLNLDHFFKHKLDQWLVVLNI